ncbi:ESPR-type extended signal peptide-containing protein [Acinetobacter sichuanensis]|uniref:ESPR-type extended signal peptide-containing protein n=2 Tax=Acinetobacter sichuanensis TaxID=2136183 RepID=A0ABV7BKX6_9GAMM
MNKIYKVIWNATLGTWVAVSEIAKGKTKSSKVKKIVGAATVSLIVTFSSEASANLAVCGTIASSGTTGAVVGNSNSTSLDANCGSGTAVAQAGIGGAIAIGDNQSNPTTAIGNDNLAIMSGATATSGGKNSTGNNIAIGHNTKATTTLNDGGRATAVGAFAEATAAYTSVFGADSKASAVGASAFGYGAKAISTRTVAIGQDAYAAGTASIAIGGAQNPKLASGVIGNQVVGSRTLSIATNSATKFTGTTKGSSGQFDFDLTIVNGVATGGTYKTLTSGVTKTLDAAAAQTLYQTLTTGAAAAGSGSGQGIAMGSSALALTTQSVSIGADSQALGEQSTALGANTRAHGDASVAIGGDDITAITNIQANKDQFKTLTGNDLSGAYVATESSGGGAVAIGATATAKGNFATAIGMTATAGGAGGAGGVAIGATSVASGDGSMAMGLNAKGVGKQSQALGTAAQALAENSTALGTKAISQGTDAVAIGVGAVAGTSTTVGNEAVAIGSDAKAFATGSIIVGGSSSISAAGTNSVAIGNNITVTNQNSVVLGANSIDKANVQHSNQTVNGIKYNFAGTSVGVVSIGAVGAERQIVNVAPGEVSATSTDAINGSQLYQTNTALETANKSLADVIGAQVNTNPNGTSSIVAPTFNVNGKNYTNIKSALDTLDNGWNVKSDANPAQAVKTGDTVDIGLATGENNLTATQTASNGTTTIDFALKKQLDLGAAGSVTTGATSINNIGINTPQVKIGDVTNNTVLTSTANGLDVGGDKITNVGKGDVSTASTDAINGSQLNAAQGSTSSIIGGGVTNNAGNLSGPFTTNGNTYNTIAEAIADQAKKSKTTVTQGENIVVTSGTNADGSANYQVATAKDVKFDKVTVGNVVTDGTTGKISGLTA